VQQSDAMFIVEHQVGL